MTSRLPMKLAKVLVQTQARPQLRCDLLPLTAQQALSAANSDEDAVITAGERGDDNSPITQAQDAVQLLLVLIERERRQRVPAVTECSAREVEVAGGRDC